MTFRAFINFTEVENTAIGVNFSYEQLSEPTISYSVVKKNKGALLLMKGNRVKSYEQLTSELRHELDHGVRIHLNFEGKGTLIRDTELEKDFSFEKAYAYYPGIKRQDFIAQTYQGSDSNFLALSRRDGIETSAFYQTYKDQVYSLSLGPFVLHAILPFVRSGNQIKLPGLEIEFAQNVIAKIANSGEVTGGSQIQVGGENVDTGILLAYASAVNVFLPVDRLEISEIEAPKICRKNFAAKRDSYSITRVSFLVLLGLLLVNAMVFFHFKEKVQLMESQSSEIEGRLSRTGTERARRMDMEKLYSTLGWAVNSVPIFYADQLAATVTPEIELSRLEIGCADEDDLKRSKRMAFNSGRIKVEGYSQGIASIGIWISSIEKLDWVKQIEEQKYQYDARSNKGFFQFVIQAK